MIEIAGVTKTYRGGVTALRDVSMDIGTGMFGLVGTNGAGKTTLMRLMAGLLRPTRGAIRVFGYDLTARRERQSAKALLGYLPQDLGVYPNLNAREFLDYMAILKGVTDRTERQRQIDHVLEVVRLADEAHRPLKTFSGGMKRRIGIAQAIIGSPRLLIVDEPTTGLDPEERIRFRNLLSDLAAERTIILSTHIVEDISHSCRDLAVMKQGRVVFRGAPNELIAAARGHVWMLIMHNGDRPAEGLTPVSTLQLAEGVQYRVLGDPPASLHAAPVEPSLEDGYMWLMRGAA